MRTTMTVEEALGILQDALSYNIPGYVVSGIALTKTEVILDYEPVLEDNDFPSANPDIMPTDSTELVGEIEDIEDIDDVTDDNNAAETTEDLDSSEEAEPEDTDEVEEEAPAPEAKPKARTSLFEGLGKPVNKKK